jgi:hypothetical protein
MRRFYFPTQDASIYERSPTRQTGLDEMLEVGKLTNGSETSRLYGAVRSLVQFDLTGLTTASQYELVLRVAFSEKIKLGEVIEVFPVSESWTEGAGYYYQDVREEDNGVSWKYASSGALWTGTQTSSIYPGNTYHTAVSASYVLDSYTKDVVIDVTNMVHWWINSGSNHGMVLKFATGSEANGSNKGIIKFFSKDTHTIHRPTLVAKVNDQVYVTGSYTSSAELDEAKIESYTLQSAYSRGETARVYLNVRETYPLKTFTTLFTAYRGTYYLPSTSYFAVTDVASGVDIIPFDEYSPISIDGGDSYVEFNTEALYPLRQYRLKYKIVQNGVTKIVSDPKLFTIRQ